ncbi:PAS domain-containing protein [Flavisolibacter sp. BT320]|nr:PAS domain-containing protein [Flavisolibacter longurius]
MPSPFLTEPIDTNALLNHLDNTAFGLLVWNENLHLLYGSDAAADLFECSPPDLQQHLAEWFLQSHNSDASNVASALDDLQSGRALQNQVIVRKQGKEGGVVYHQWHNSAQRDHSGKVKTIISLVQDVTQQTEAKFTVEKSRQRLSLAFNSAIDPMWLIRSEGNNVFWFETINHAFTNVTGWTAEQVEGTPIEKIMPEASHDLVRSKYNEAIETGKIIDYVEEALHPSGIKYGEIRVIPIRGEAGEPVRILGIANDITERVYLQKKLDAERENRNRFITSAAIRGQESERAKVGRELHDNVNQVLTTVKLFIELCIDQRVELQTVLPRCVTYLNNTINEIRSLSRQLSAPSLGSRNFKDTLSDLVESMESAALLHVQLDMESLPFADLESELHLAIYRVAQEQLTNIVRYAKASRVLVSLTADASRLYFTIADNGVGFDTTQKRPGIGITNMQSRVETLNGSFLLWSQPFEGTKMEVTIPVLIEDSVCYAEQLVLDGMK